MALFRGEGDGSIPRREFITLEIPNNPPAAGAYWLFVADHDYNVTQVREVHSVVGGAAYLIAGVRKVQSDGIAPGAAAGANVIELLPAAGISLTSTANTVQNVAPAVSTIAKGDRIAIVFSGVNTGYVGSIQIEIEAR